MRILLSNDDGIHAQGLQDLYSVLIAAGHEVMAVAPGVEQSGASCSLHMRDPLRATKVEHGNFSGMAVNGTPVDCVKFALTTLYDTPPDLVISGINAGCNMGTDVFYSGTVGAATEAALQGVPALALSRLIPELEPPLPCARHAAELLKRIDWGQIPKNCVLNVNYPHCLVADIRGIRICRMSLTGWLEHYVERQDPSGRPYWWISGYKKRDSGGNDTDIAALREHYISLTPLLTDRTDYTLTKQLNAQLCPQIV